MDFNEVDIGTVTIAAVQEVPTKYTVYCIVKILKCPL
jgi:hypothetical protein